MGTFDVDPKVWEEYGAKIKADAQAHVGPDVIVAAPFRHGGASAKMAVSKSGVGALAYGAVSLFNRQQAGGLPERTMLIVTPTMVHAYKYKLKGRGMPITGDELAAWQRSGLRVSTEQKMGVTMLTIDSQVDGMKVTLAPAGIKDDPLSQELIAELRKDQEETLA